MAEEQFANTFASEFLMPEAGIKRLLVMSGSASGRLEPHDVLRLCRHFGVSFQAILHRLLRLRLLRQDDVQRLQGVDRPVALVRSIGEPNDTGEWSGNDLDLTQIFPASYLELVLDAFDRREITNGRAAELLALNRGAFDQFYRHWRQQDDARLSEELVEHVVG